MYEICIYENLPDFKVLFYLLRQKFPYLILEINDDGSWNM